MIQPGDVVFIMHHDSKLSKLIAWFMRSKWSHSALVVDVSESGEIWLSETTDTQIAHGRFSSYLNDPACTLEVLSPIGVSRADLFAGIAEAENNTGRIYAYWQLLSLAVVCIGERLGLRLPNVLPFGFVCNSHVLDAVQAYPIAPLHGVKPQSIHTERMYSLMRGASSWRTVFEKKKR